MRRKLAGLLVGLAILIPVLAAPVSAVSCNGYAGVTIYENINYGGASYTWCSTATSLPHIPQLWPYNWNDRVSSYKFFNGSGRCVRLYADEQYANVFVTSCGTSNVPNIGIYWQSRFFDGFNDQTSSIYMYNN